MQWAKKTQKITPISATVERKLLQNAYKKQPSNALFFNKLINAYLHENKLGDAINLCETHLEKIGKAPHAFTALMHAYRKRFDHDNVIRIGHQAMHYSPTQSAKLCLANAYAQQGHSELLTPLMPNDVEYSDMNNDNLRLALQTWLIARQPQTVCRLYEALPKVKQSDAGATSSYIKALHLIGRTDAVAQRLDYPNAVKQVHLTALNENTPLNVMNQTLAFFLSSHSKQQFEPGGHTAKLGSQMHFESDWHPLLVALEAMIRSQVECFLTEFKPYETYKPSSLSLHLWANILGQGGHQISHIHPDALISGVYYIKVPTSIEIEALNNTNHQGYLLFSQTENKPYYVRPQEGLLVLFPSYLYHQTVPLTQKETRMCIAFDVVKQHVNHEHTHPLK